MRHFTMWLWCDDCDAPGSYEVSTAGMCLQQARNDGWTLGKRDRCPECNEAKKYRQEREQ